MTTDGMYRLRTFISRLLLQFCPFLSQVTGSTARWYFTDGPKTASTCLISLLMRFPET